MPPLVFGLEYYGPHLPTGPGAVPILSNSTRPQTVWRLLTGLLSWPPTSYSFLASPLGRVFFPSKASAGTCAVQKRTRPRMSPKFPSEDTRPSVSPSSVAFSLHSYASPWGLKEDGQEEPHKRQVGGNTPTQSLLRSKLLAVSHPSSWVSPLDRALED